VAVGEAKRPLAALGGVLFMAVFFGGWMYLLVIRRYVRSALAEANEVAEVPRESTSSSTRRALPRILVLVIVFVPLALIGRGSPIIGGIAAGSGATMLAASYAIGQWEREHSVEILREPRWRWRREKGRRGRGVIDSQDFYFVRVH
jgi:hypothetical protein